MSQIEMMIDIETLDVVPRSIVLSVGAVPFTQEDGALVDKAFYKRFELQSQFEKGRTVSQDTLFWWNDQDANVRSEAFGLQRFEPDKVLKALFKECKGIKNIWANGPMFDIIILEDLARDYGIFDEVTWMFYQTRDLRTIKEEAGLERNWKPDSLPELPKKFKGLGAHHPVTDCIVQIEQLRSSREILPLAGM